MFYVLEAPADIGEDYASGRWQYATTRTFDTAADAALFIATSIAAHAKENRFPCFKLAPANTLA